MYDRLITLIGQDNLNLLQQAKILLIGVGGVGGFILEGLIRSGIQNITIIDGDIIEETNLNRQIITHSKNIGKYKAEEAFLRSILINPQINIKRINSFLTPTNLKEYLTEEYDYIIDACDDIPINVELIKYAQNHHIKIISALGMGKKLDVTQVRITKLSKTYNDALAKKLRYLIKKENLSLDIPVVFSPENPINSQKLGSAIFVPAIAGLYIANYVFKDILNLIFIKQKIN